MNNELFVTLNDYELYSIDGGGIWDVVKDAAI